MYGKLLSDSTVTSGSALFAIAGTSLCEDQELLGKRADKGRNVTEFKAKKSTALSLYIYKKNNS